MSPVQGTAEVFDLIQRFKTGATDYCTNFFPIQARLEQWIAARELAREEIGGSAVFLRRDRDFEHLYFCAHSASVLSAGLASVKDLETTRVVTDLIGPGPALDALVSALKPAGFREYGRLQRMSRMVAARPPGAGGRPDAPEVTWARAEDAPAALSLIEAEFNRYCDQLPSLQDLAEAIARRQVLTVRAEDRVAALLFFETQGFTSTLRYWAVGEGYRDRRFGSALIHAYFAAHPAVKRFVLWVAQTNHNAIAKYQHYGYAPDGLVDIVMANKLVPDEISR